MLFELRKSMEEMGMEWNAYLGHIKKTEDQLRSEWQKDAEKRVRYALVLRNIAEEEHIEPQEDEVNTWTYNYLASRDEEEKKHIDQAKLKEYAYGILRNNKVFEFLENLVPSA